MDRITPGDLVTATDGSRSAAGIVFDTSHRAKVAVAVIDRVRGPVLRSFSPNALTARTTASPDDQALQLLIRRTPVPGRSGPPAPTGPGRGSSGHSRPTSHRTTGK